MVTPNAVYTQNYASDLGPSGGNNTSGRPQTGVTLGPLNPWWGKLNNWGGSMRTQAQPAPAPTTPPVIENIRQMYGNLGTQLNQLSATEADRIAQSSGNTVRALQAIDPMAGYRQTAPMLAAPQAAATSYLQAIGANPSQVTAQQALANQLMQSQSQSQDAFTQAMDQYANQYRRAQEAEVYSNQDRALAALNAATQSQNVGLQMARMEQENAIRKMLLDYQIALATAKIQRGGGGQGGTSLSDLTQVLF